MKQGRLPNRGWVCRAMAVIVASLFPVTAMARVFQPGEANDALVDPLTGVTLADRPDLVGQIIADLTVPFDNGQVLQGTIHTYVVREDATGTLDFYYQLSRTIDVYSISGFKNFSTDVDFRADIGQGAQGAHRSNDGNTLDFVFVNNAGPMFVKTNATTFDLVGKFEAFDDNGDPNPATAAVYAPTSTVIPLPPALFSAPIGFVLAALGKRFLRR
jgi:hypothetical protein